MSRKLLMTFLVVLALVFVFSSTGFCESKQALLGQIDQAKEGYYAKKYEIDNKVRTLSREWHIYQLQMHEKIRANPAEKRAIRAEIWAGAKELSEKKKALYNQLTPLRKEWHQTRVDLEAQIADINAAEAAQRD